MSEPIEALSFEPDLTAWESTPERRYARSTDIAHRKRLAQFFTPPRLASLMADWIAEIEPGVVLEPAVGAGVLARATLSRSPSARVFAYEKDARILSFADLGDARRISVENSDFLSAPYQQFDAVISNPPYIRHREIEGYEAVRADLSVRSRCLIPKSANLYVYFVTKCILQLREGGRGAFLIPSEWMNANFSSTFKQFLIRDPVLKHVVLFSGCSNIFEDALTTASILLVER